MATAKKGTGSSKRPVKKSSSRVTPLDDEKEIVETPQQKNKKKSKKNSKKKGNNEIKGVICIAFGVFLVLSFFTETTGLFGELTQDLMKGLFGEASAIFFVFVIWTGLNMFVEEKEEKITKKMWLLLAVMAGLSMLGALWNEELIVWNSRGFWATAADLYKAQIGGAVGGMLCILFRACIGVVGTYILSFAVMLILIILMTEISIERILKAVTGRVWVRKDADGDDEDDGEDKASVPIRKKSTRSAAAVEDERFSEYIDGDYEEPKIQRFRFDDDVLTGEIEQELLSEEMIEKYMAEKKKTKPKVKSVAPKHFLPDDENPFVNKPFKMEDLQQGVLTELPDENGNFKEKKDDDFEPPSMVQMEEKVDPLTQSAIDAGVPLDRAVEVGKRMSKQEVQQAANSVDAMAKESIEATKIINYKLPSVSLLASPKGMTKSRAEMKRELEDKANRLLETLASFKVEAKILNITQGPSVTRFELQPGFGIKVSKITNLADDIALSLAAAGVRIEAPIPGKSAIGIEIPNEKSTPVPIREVIDTDKFREFKSKTAFALGKDISGNCVIADVASFPHILIAGATGSGKSVCINSLITSILYKAKPNEVKMIMVDPKMVELGVYNGIPHLLIPVVTDPKHAAGALNWAVAEMKNRYQLMKDNKVRNIQGYNELMEESGTPENKLPEIVIIIDELADLMLAAKNEVEDAINSLAALARAAGMYLVIATQRPSVDVITGVIKANVPSRISFAVSSQVDSRTILDSMGAEKLLGKGDMLYAPRGANKPMRIQGNFLSDEEIESVISFIKKQYEAEYDESILEHIEREQEHREDAVEEDTHTRSGEKDSMFYQAAEYAVDSGQASVAMLQRKYKIGYQRAARIIDQLEENRIIGPYEGTKPRQVLISRAELNEMMMNNSD